VPLTRREAVSRRPSGTSALELSAIGTGLAQDPTDGALPPGIVALQDFETLARRRLARKRSNRARRGGRRKPTPSRKAWVGFSPLVASAVPRSFNAVLNC
jgi:hypothetical protein